MSELKSSEVRAVIDEFTQGDDRYPCIDNSCAFGPPGGMATNGGCRCWDSGRDFHPADRLSLARIIRIMAIQIVTLRKAQP
jgi:hypothetical protein